MPTFTFVLRTSRARKDGRAPIWIRISDTTGARYIYTQLSVLPRDWNPNRRQVRRSHGDWEDLNKAIARDVAAAERAYHRLRANGKPVTLDAIKERVVAGGSDRDFFDFAREIVGRMERSGQAESAKRYKHIVESKLKGHTGAPLPFGRIDVRLLRDWEASMIEKGNAPGTVSTAFRAIRAIS